MQTQPKFIFTVRHFRKPVYVNPFPELGLLKVRIALGHWRIDFTWQLWEKRLPRFQCFPWFKRVTDTRSTYAFTPDSFAAQWASDSILMHYLAQATGCTKDLQRSQTSYCCVSTSLHNHRLIQPIPPPTSRALTFSHLFPSLPLQEVSFRSHLTRTELFKTRRGQSRTKQSDTDRGQKDIGKSESSLMNEYIRFEKTSKESFTKWH